MTLITSPYVKTYTIEEFWNLLRPEDGSKLELIKRVLYITPAPNTDEIRATAALLAELDKGIQKFGYPGAVQAPGSLLWQEHDTSLEPSLLYDSDTLNSGAQHHIRADLVVDLVCVRTAMYVGRTKPDTYRFMGVREMWLVDTEKKEIEVQSFEAGKTAVYRVADVLHSEVLPKIELPVAAVFP